MAVVVLAVALLSSWSCKKSDEVTETATYIIIVSAGVTGTPAAGELTLTVGSPLQYNFSLQAGYSTLAVLLDDAVIASVGTLNVVSGTHYLQAYADDNAQYSLKVTLADGVSGTPEAGTRYYPKDTAVEYGYSANEGYTGLQVTIDAVAAAASGTIVMNSNHVVSAAVSIRYNIRGAWALTEAYEDGSSFKVTATFSGDYESGTVVDSDGGSGTYAVSGSTAAFTLLFPGVTYEYDGKFSAADTMSGTCKRYLTADDVIEGSWTATRNAATTVAFPGRISGAQGKARKFK